MTRAGGLPALLGLAAAAVVLAAMGPNPSAEWRWILPPGFPEPVVPADNPMSAAKVELGRHLFYDRRLSGNGTYSCASCHDQAKAFTDGLARGIGSTDEVHPRGSMSLANIAYAPVLTWANPNMTTLEQQAPVPMFGEDPVELGIAGMDDSVIARFAAEPRYRVLFPAAFPAAPGSPVTMANVVKAIAAFQRTLISGDSPYDRAQHGRPAAMSASARRGQELFFSEKTECFHCHGGITFTGPVIYKGKGQREVEFHNTGLYNLGGTGRYPAPNVGLMEHTGLAEDMGKFKAPTLRNIAVTAPYMHDGSIATLDAVLDHYMAAGRTIRTGPDAGVGADSPYKSELIVGFTLTPGERADLLAFLRSLTDSTFLTEPRFGDPWKIRDWKPPVSGQ